MYFLLIFFYVIVRDIQQKYNIQKFHDVILRVGICFKGTNEAKFFMTDAEKELRELLKL